MGFFDDMFGGLFDFNGDGETDFMESVVGLHILDEMDKEDDEEDDEEDDDDEDDYEEDDYEEDEYEWYYNKI